MLQVIFVDDEEAMLEELRHIVDWDKFDIHIAGAFLTPQDALTFLESVQVDIIISDISMPVINGVEFAHRVRIIDERVRIIFLSAYEDFSYAQAAMRLGLCDYLLKPVSAADIESSILKVCDGIEMRTRQEAYIMQLEKKAGMSEVYLRDRLLQSMILMGNADSNEMKKKLAQHHIIIESELFQVMLTEADIQNPGGKSIPIYEATIRETIRDVLENLHLILFADLNGRLCLIIEQPSYEYSLLYDPRMIARKIHDILKLDLNLEVSIGCSETYKGIGNLYKAYLEALYALEYGAYTGSEQFTRYGSLPPRMENLPMDQYKLRSSLIYHLRCGNLSNVKQLLQEVRQEVKKNLFPLHYARMLYIDIIISLNIIMQEIGVSAAEVFGTNTDPVILIYQMDNLEACDRAVNRYCEIIVSRINSGEGQSRNQILVNNVAQRIESELSNSNLSVHSLANSFYVSEDHLNVLFKSVMKTSLKRYIIDRKMERAHELLSKGNCSVNRAAKETGFLDALYFSKSYKKYFGVAPSETIKNSNGNFPLSED